jgi:hypothetical protein
MWEYFIVARVVNPNSVNLLRPRPTCFRSVISRLLAHELQIFLLRTPLLCGIHAGPWRPFT